MKRISIQVATCCLAVTIAGIGVLLQSGTGTGLLAQVAGPPSPALAKAWQLSDAFRTVSRNVLPAVVSIQTRGRVVKTMSPGGADLDPFLRGLLGDSGFGDLREQRPREYRAPSGQGSGFITSADGVVLTNAHVVADAEQVIVRLADGREFSAEKLGVDERADIAVLRIDVQERLPFLPLGNDDDMDIGDWVLAFGSPFGLHRSVTQGIISAKGRGLDGDDKEFLQTDAAINPGNSGGPLVNLRGEVIGINTAISTRSGGYDGVSLAIPVNLVKWVAQQLENEGVVRRAYVGIQMQEINAALAQQLNLRVPEGVVVTDVVPDSPADRAGFNTGDVILEVNGRRIRNPLNMMGVVERLTVGDAYRILVQRDGREQELRIVAGERPGARELARRRFESPSRSATDGAKVLEELEAAVQQLTPSIAEQLGLEETQGVVITEIRRGGRADRLGLEPGMVIAAVANRPISGVDDLIEALEISRENGRILLLVKKNTGRANVSKFISVPLNSN
ncbi:MAG: Do family serine endopeptidase [Planctomycetaceae bacterium]|nr:Do family serine endopeptidase [Planctomycetaceae bacterium]